MQYVGDVERPMMERLWWLLVLIVTFIGSVYLIAKLWIKWDESPVIVSFAETTTPVWQIPFPAVTVCSETKSMRSKFDFTATIKSNITAQSDYNMFQKLGALSLLCEDHVIVDGNKTLDFSAIEFLFETSPPFNETMFVCKWDGKATEGCGQLFSTIMTDEGLCFSFNMLSEDELFHGNGIPLYTPDRKSEGWTLENGYAADSPLDTYPRRALFAGLRGGLTFVLKYYVSDSDFYCKGPVQGFRILLHNPAEVPNMSDRYIRVPLHQEVVAAVTPKIMTTSNGLRSYPPSRRQCFFPSERHLKYFKVYTQRNCDLECITNFTINTCGCIALYMPGGDEIPICGPGSKSCILQAAEEMVRREVEASYKSLSADSCDCRSSCTSLIYDAETSQADFKAAEVFKAYTDDTSAYDGYEMARVSIFFKDFQFTTSRRSELFGLVDFLANCGGLLGLFAGVSFLSLVEIFYFSTIRLWINFRRLKQKTKAPSAGNELNTLPAGGNKFSNED